MPRTLLLADDSVTIQKVVGISFANEDVQLLTVDNGDDAIARAREARPDAVLADVVMPGKNGYEVCEAIKSDPALRHIPVLLLTGTFEAFDAERAKLAGADGFVTKPFEAQLLVDRVNELLARSASPAPVPPPVQTTLAPVPPDAAAAAPPAPGGAPPEHEAETRAVEEDLDLAGGDDAFVFEAEDALAATAPPGARAPLEVTAPEAFDDPLADGDLFEGGDATSTRVLDDDAFALEAPGPVHEAARSAVFDFEGSELPPEPVEAAAAPPPASETRILEEWSEPDEEFAGLDARVAEEGPSELDLELAGALATAGGAAEAPAGDSGGALLDPGAREFDVSSSDLGDPLVGDFAPRPTAPATPPAAPTAAAGAAGPAEAPAALRQELTAQLEKIAWEAFGDLAETLVRQTVARVEAIAWEVIPQMAENLIREEIRKLKEES